LRRCGGKRVHRGWGNWAPGTGEVVTPGMGEVLVGRRRRPARREVAAAGVGEVELGGGDEPAREETEATSWRGRTGEVVAPGMVEVGAGDGGSGRAGAEGSGRTGAEGSGRGDAEGSGCAGAEGSGRAADG